MKKAKKAAKKNSAKKAAKQKIKEIKEQLSEPDPEKSPSHHTLPPVGPPQPIEGDGEPIDAVRLEDAGFEKPETEYIMIVGDHPNPMWKKGILKAGSGEGCKVWVPKRVGHKLRHKILECQRVDENGETYYKYQP